MNIKTFSIKWHKKLAWFGAAAVFIWIISGFTHPLMSWLGPQSKSFFPPSMQMSANQLDNFSNLIGQKSLLMQARVIKFVPSQQGPVLQLTLNEGQARQYIDIKSGKTLANFDQQQAIWLAQHYTGQTKANIQSVSFITEFSADYPWVNRLLPVYKINFNDGTQAYLHTETLALASLTNPTKNSLKAIFQQLHTFKWLDTLEYGRVILIALFMLTAMAFALTGLALVIKLKNRKVKDSARRNHRWLAYLLWLPLLGWSTSGFYHLIQASFIDQPSGLRLAQPLGDNLKLSSNFNWLNELTGKKINSLSLVKNENGDLLYRVSFAIDKAKSISRVDKFKGQKTEKSALYINATTGQKLANYSDMAQAKWRVAEYANITPAQIQQASLVTHYGPNYDFRNKRLPVWQFNLDNADKSIIFIDPVTNVVVDQSRRIDRAERWSFSVLHKWSHLTPFMGRFYRDVLIVFILFLIGISTTLGVVMLIKSKSKQRVA